MSRRLSYSQRVFPRTFEFTATLARLKKRGVKTMLDSVWSGLDRFKAEILDRNPPPTRQDRDLERDLTELIFPHVQRAVGGDFPYYLHHERKEREATGRVGQPPEPDLSFIFYANPRITFPIDSKVVDRDRVSDVADYVDTVNNRFLTCIYAPFSKEGAMLAFLLAGGVAALFRSLQSALGCPLSRRPYCLGRNHRTSRHERVAVACKFRPFVCHHMVMPVGPAVGP
jgi:hypothetical protein